MPDLLPPNATPQERALSLALDRLPDVPIKHLWSPQTCPAGILPWLGWALSVDEWDPTWPEQTQRNVIAASIENHRRKGTIGALRQALSRIGYEVEIDEQTGQAYTFALRLKLNAGEAAGGALAGQQLQKAIEVARKAKNVRSELASTIFLGEGAAAVLYSGGVPIVGAEVEIGAGEATALPLDGLNDSLMVSFWTIRMNRDYQGPIGRVRRASDSAELDYFSSYELRQFVGAGSWEFVRLYNQRGLIQELAYPKTQNDQFNPSPGIAGAFDIYGRPMFIANSTARNFTIWFSEITTEAISAVGAVEAPTLNGCGQVFFDKAVVSPTFGTFQEHPIFNLFQNIVTFQQRANLLLTGWNAVTPPRAIETSGAARFAVAGRVSGTTAQAITSTGVDSKTGAIPAGGFRFTRLRLGNYGGTGNSKNYGAAAWFRDLGETTLSALVADINSHLNP
jgi:phage tail P2-like protein